MNPQDTEEAKQVHSSSKEESARSLGDMANSGNSLQGYAAMNDVPENSARLLLQRIAKTDLMPVVAGHTSSATRERSRCRVWAVALR